MADAYASETGLASPDGSCAIAIRHGTPRPFSYSLRTRWPGPLGATMNTLTFAGGTIFRKWMLKPCAQAR